MSLPTVLGKSTEPAPQEDPNVLSVEAIDERMKRDGFPELELLWQQFRRMIVGIDQLSDAQIHQSRIRHMQPLFGRPWLVTLWLLLVSAVTVLYLVRPMHFGAGKVYSAVLQGLYFLAVPFLAVMLLTWLQRRIVYPLDRIMALDTALMLSRSNYRQVVESSPESRAVVEVLHRAGVNSQWDNPAYRRSYVGGKGGVDEVDAPVGLPFVLLALRVFLGHKDEARRQFVAGRYTTDLKAGKKSVTEFVASHQQEIESLKAGTLELPNAIELLRSLREIVSAGSAGMFTLDELIEAAENGTFLTSGQLRAEIWQRDPWVDLTHQQEFYSSASLRGVHWMGRSTKGRLGTFGYLRNRAISALDLRSRRKRLVRCRLAAALSLQSSGSQSSVLFVDGVEGTNAVAPEVIQRAIEDYARRAGFQFVAYNARVHNRIPRRFVDFLAARGEKVRELGLRIVTADVREYLDAFGTPLEPFEYAIPVGTVLAYVRSLQPGEAPLPGREPTVRHLAYQWARMNCLWIVLTFALSLMTMIMIPIEPMLLAIFGPLVLVGLWFHFRYQNKSLRQATES